MLRTATRVHEGEGMAVLWSEENMDDAELASISHDHLYY